MAQSVEHVIGNDEVISSILITSSKKSASAKADALFLTKFALTGNVYHFPCDTLKEWHRKKRKGFKIK